MAWMGAALAASREPIGSWVLACPRETADAKSCVLRTGKRLFDQSGVTGDLEIWAAGKSLVPVIALRGLPDDVMLAAAMAGSAEASLRFGDGPAETLGCAPDGMAYLCSAHADAAMRLALALPAARAVTVRVTVALTGLKPLTVQDQTIDLTGTNEALGRLRAAGAAQVPGLMDALKSGSPSGFAGVADRTLKAAGYPNGLADLWGLLAKYLGMVR
jgi:hypothetical protein